MQAELQVRDTTGIVCRLARPGSGGLNCTTVVIYAVPMPVVTHAAHSASPGPAEKVGDDRSGVPGDEVAGSPNSFVALAALYAILALPAAVAPHTVSLLVFVAFIGVLPWWSILCSCSCSDHQVTLPVRFCSWGAYRYLLAPACLQSTSRLGWLRRSAAQPP